MEDCHGKDTDVPRVAQVWIVLEVQHPFPRTGGIAGVVVHQEHLIESNIVVSEHRSAVRGHYEDAGGGYPKAPFPAGHGSIAFVIRVQADRRGWRVGDPIRRIEDPPAGNSKVDRVQQLRAAGVAIDHVTVPEVQGD